MFHEFKESHGFGGGIFIVVDSSRERVVTVRRTSTLKFKPCHANACGHTLSIARQSVRYVLVGAVNSLEVTTKTAVAMSMTPMPTTLARSPNCCVTQPNVVIPAMAAVIAPVP